MPTLTVALYNLGVVVTKEDSVEVLLPKENHSSYFIVNNQLHALKDAAAVHFEVNGAQAGGGTTFDHFNRVPSIAQVFNAAGQTPQLRSDVDRHLNARVTLTGGRLSTSQPEIPALLPTLPQSVRNAVGGEFDQVRQIATMEWQFRSGPHDTSVFDHLLTNRLVYSLEVPPDAKVDVCIDDQRINIPVGDGNDINAVIFTDELRADSIPTDEQAAIEHLLGLMETNEPNWINDVTYSYELFGDPKTLARPYKDIAGQCIFVVICPFLWMPF